MHNPKAMLRWMVAGSEIARAITEFDTNCKMSSKRGSQQERHHEHTLYTQTSFARDMNALVETIDSYGNPFEKETSDLLVLDSRDTVDSKISQIIHNMEKIGRLQHNEFTEERLIQGTKSVAASITRNNFPLLGSRPLKNSKRSTPLVSSPKSDCALFSRLFVSCQTRDGDLENFFQHENHSYPPSLSQFGDWFGVDRRTLSWVGGEYNAMR